MKILSALCVLPLAGALLLLFFPRKHERAIRIFGLAISLAVLALSACLVLRFNPQIAGFQFVERYAWSEAYGISFHLGVDGLSLGLVVLTALLVPLCILLSYRTVGSKIKVFLISFMMLETGLIGVFTSLDLFLFYIFWELVLVPMYFIIGIWGHEKRLYATTKFVLYTLVGSLLMLVGLLGLVTAHVREFGIITFDLTRMYGIGLSHTWQVWIFLCLFMGFAIKIPLFPFHTWLPDAHVQAPAAGSVMLAGVLLKMGVYGFLRIALPTVPQVAMEAAPWIITLSIIGIVYGSLVALAQDDMKRMVAYSSVAHLGFCVMGLFSLTPEGVSGSVLQMINHGISTGALFLLIGMLYERAHSHRIADFGGLAARMPRFTAIFGVMVFSSIGLPGLNNFVGEFLSIFGLFRVSRVAACVSLVGIVLAAWYMLRMFRHVFLGPVSGLSKSEPLTRDLSVRETALIAPLVLAVFWIGLWPEPLLGSIRPASRRLIAHVESGFIPDVGPQWAMQDALPKASGGTAP